MMNKHILIILSLLLFFSFIPNSFAANEISVIINDERIIFSDQKPVIISSRVLVPIRAVFEKLGAEVNWVASERKITIENDEAFITLFIDDFNIVIEQKIFNNTYVATTDVAPRIISGRTMVPLNAVSAALGTEIMWNGGTRTVHIKTPPKDEINTSLSPFIIDGVELNLLDSKDSLIQKLGNPSRIEQSQYSFKWYIYNDDYTKYIQVGILDDKIVAFYSNSPKFSYKGVISSTSNGDALRILKSDENENTKKIFVSDALTRSVIYNDNHNNSNVDAALVMLKEAAKGDANRSVDVLSSFEKQIFDLTNVMRVKNNLEPLIWNDMAASSARKHSKDMGDKNYFAHESLDGRSPFDRMNSEGVSFHMAAENISCGQPDAFDSYTDWINSEGHRKNILNRDFKMLGVGVAVNGDTVYYTQNFFTP